jgi:D-alanyl-D-alanine carboxypeptidase
MRRALFFWIIILFGGLVKAQSTRALLDSLVEAEALQRQFSGVVLLAQNGQVFYQQAVGQARAAQAMQVHTPMRLASITKAFTAVLVMQLVEAGKLTTASSIAEVLPALEIKRAKQITVDHLLLHTSGLPSEPDALYATPLAAQDMVRRSVAQGKYGRRGRFHYCNLDYMILGLMVEKLTGQPWAEALQARILTPLGMTETGVAYQDMETLAQGYLSREHEGQVTLRPEPSFHIENFHAAGAMYGTAADLLKFDQALYADQLLQPETIAQMYTSHPELGYVAYGSWVYDYYFLPSSPRLVERRGKILGFNHVFIRMPELNKTLIILSNNDRFDSDTFGQLDSFKDQLIAALVER